MTISEYEEIIGILRQLIANTEFEGKVYSVGGCERDRLLQREIKDIDLVVELPNGGIKFAKWLEENGLTEGSVVVYEHFGTAMFKLKECPKHELEAVQTRKECYHDSESRNPETSYGTIKDDCTRRDFTYNAIYRNITSGEVCDFNGSSLHDLANNILRTCGDADVIFKEDPLRILRAIRFATRYESKIEKLTWCAMLSNYDRLSIISKERIQDEFDKIIISKNRSLGLDMLWATSAMKYIIPQLNDIPEKKMREIGVCLRVYGYVTNEPISVPAALTILLSFVEGPRNIRKILADLKYSNEVIDITEFLSHHLLDVSAIAVDWNTKMNKVRELQHTCKERSVYKTLVETWSCITGRYSYASKLIALDDNMFEGGECMYGYKLPVDGNDVMKHMGVGPSKEVKEVLDELMQEAFKKPDINRRRCIQIIKRKKDEKANN